MMRHVCLGWILSGSTSQLAVFILCLFRCSASEPIEKRCKLPVIDALKWPASKPLPADYSWILTNAYHWPEEKQTHEYAQRNLGNITIKVGNDVGLQSTVAQGYGQSPKPMTIAAWMDQVKDEVSPYQFNWCLGPCIRQLSRRVDVPIERMKEFMTGKSFLSLGKGRGIPLHFHGISWVAQLSGRKLWALAPEDKQPPGTERGVSGVQEVLSKKDRGTFRCEQHPGEIVYVPSSWWHTTENLEWQTSYGFQPSSFGQGDPTNAALPMVYRHEHVPPAVDTAVKVVFSNVSGLESLSDDQVSPHLHTLVDSAIRNGHLPVMKHLLAFSKKVSVSLPFFGDLLHDAAVHGHAGLVQFFLKKTNGKGDTPSPRVMKVRSQAVNGAMAAGMEDVYHMLLESRADVCGPTKAVTKTSAKNTCLHVAAQRGHARMIELLLAERCDPNEKNKEKQTAFDMAYSPAPSHLAVRALLSAAADGQAQQTS